MKKDQEQNEIKMGTLINISHTPSNIDLSDIKIDQGGCFINSYRVAKKYQSIEIVEGIILAPDYENGPKPLPHVWNKKGEVHFDVTKEKVLSGTNEENADYLLKYISVKLYKHTDFKNGDIFEFCNDTYENVNAIKEAIKNNSKDKTDDLLE